MSSSLVEIASRNLLLGYIGGLFPFMGLIAVKTVNAYAEADFPRHTFVTLYIAFFCSFSMFMLIPIDIASTVRDRNAAVQIDSTSKYKDDTGMLSTIYFVFYVVLLLWNNIVLAMQEYYNTDGYFTPGSRGKSSFRRWLNDTVPAIVIGLVVLGVLIGGKEVPSSPVGLKIVLVTLTTAIYETILMFLLGYGYVELPKLLWNQGNHQHRLLTMQAKASADFASFRAAQFEVQKVTASVLKTKEKVGTSGEALVQEALSIMLAECPQEFKSARLGEVAADKTGKVTIDTLAALRTRLNITKSTYRMAQARLETTQLGSYMAEDMVDASNRNNRRNEKFDGQKVIRWQLKGCESSLAEYRWLMVHQPFLCRIAAVFCGVLSLLSLIGAMSSMKGVPKQSSMFFAVVHAPTESRGGIAFFISLTFGYSVIVALWSLLQLKSLGFELVFGRTTPYNLSACFRMVASIAFPLTFFYLGWMGENGTEKEGQWMYFSELRNHSHPIIEQRKVNAGVYYTNDTMWVPKLHRNVTVKVWHNRTEVVSVHTTAWRLEPDYMPAAFAQFYQLPPSTNKAFGTVYPVMLLIFVLLFLLKIYNRIVVLLKMPTYQFGDPVVTKEQLDEGMSSLNKYRKIAQRSAQRQEVAKKRAAKDADRSIRFFGLLIWKRETLREMEERLDKEARDLERKNRPISSEKLGAQETEDVEALVRKAEKAAADHIHVNIPQPAHLTGTTHIRGVKLGAEKESWIDVYMEVRPPGILYILKDISCTDSDPPTLDPLLPAPIDIINVISCRSSSKVDSQGRVIVRVDQADEFLKFRLPSADEAKHWADRLNEWKDYSILYKQEVEAVQEHRRRETERILDQEAHYLFYAPLAPQGSDHASSPRKSLRDRISIVGKSAKVFAPKEPMTINPMRLAGSAAARYDMNSKQAQFTTDVNLDIKPDVVEGWLELKSFTPVWFGNKYKHYYFRIHDGTSSMQYFHDDVSCDEAVSPVGFLDLTVADEAVPSSKYKDARDLERFHCKVNGLTYYFKAPHANEAKLWVRKINVWREYLLLRYAVRGSERAISVQKIIDSRAAAASAKAIKEEERGDEQGEDLESKLALAEKTATSDTAPLTSTTATITDSSSNSALTGDSGSGDSDTQPSLSPKSLVSSSILPRTSVSLAAASAVDGEDGAASSPFTLPQARAAGRLKVSPRQSQALPLSLLEATGIAEVELGALRHDRKADSKKKSRSSLSAATEKKGDGAKTLPM